MKILFESQEPRDGYKTIRLINQKIGQLNGFKELLALPKNSIEELISHNIISFLCKDTQLLHKFFIQLYDILEPNAIISLCHISSDTLAFLINTNQLQLPEIHKIVFGYGKLGGFISNYNLKNVIPTDLYDIQQISLGELYTTMKLIRKPNV